MMVMRRWKNNIKDANNKIKPFKTAVIKLDIDI